MRKLTIFFLITLTLVVGCEKENNKNQNIHDEFHDLRDGRVYKTIKIGDQVWMAENLYYKSQQGSIDYENDTIISNKYGKLYNWESACEVCPKSWHLPSKLEWDILIEFLGGNENAGGKLKEIDTINWNYPNTGATNSSGFKALPSGYRSFGYDFEGLGIGAAFWTSTNYSDTGYYSNTAYYKELRNKWESIGGGNYNKESFYSVRCIKD